jgi:hypothetical protein
MDGSGDLSPCLKLGFLPVYLDGRPSIFDDDDDDDNFWSSTGAMEAQDKRCMRQEQKQSCFSRISKLIIECNGGRDIKQARK